ncbi:adenosylcobinamide kinase/adenosylcobinamide-phosphate guanylyltransferase [Evansella vedderi]|uniref:Adenosylcobinamide kinase n=1 Tax=Evansella vedderi TaxID=38282 RepID=A0ABT9ZZF7_9BACI|nr:bifunctional adenosylcobinamide kinase/adenosylcobinamide-phosphate guanylyltransferase [Evansella vedderi]MDQ0256355.1 adenosylcobinamide kinase/adenosylcobinamide-phosphate guanylyltransferase [Evansella vedderi]
MIVFVSGGARSGKSSFAEKLAIESYRNIKEKSVERSLYYVATANRLDQEMEKRINLHQERRRGDWITVEEPYDILSFLLETKKGDVVLFDCLTIWLSNRMFDFNHDVDQLIVTIQTWLKVAVEKEIVFIIVSNDLNEGIPLPFQTVHNYIYNLEKLHREIIPYSDQVIQMIAGLPTYWKGEGK